MAAQEIRVPDIGDFTDVPIIEVLVSPGDTVAAEDPLLVSQLSERIRSIIQATILEKLKTRPGVFLGE